MSKTLTVGVPDEVLPLSSSPPSPSSPLTRRALLVIIMSVAVLTSLLSTFMMTYLPKMQIVSSVLDDNNSSTATADGEGGLVTSLDKEGTLNNTDIADDLVMPSVRKDFSRWMAHLRAFGAGDNTAGIRSVRTACRELEANAQTCVFEGLFCVDVANGTAHGRAKVFIVDDSQTDGATVPSDNWCRERHQSADPRYFSARRWPFPTDTVAPQRSCLDARYRTTSSLFGTGDAFANNESAELASFTSRMKWLPSLALVDLDYVDNTHNNHLVKDILWLLDAALFQKSLSIEKRPGYTVHRALNDVDGYLFRTEPHIYLPQTRAQFEKQTSKDVNRLTYSIILRKNARRLYPNLTDEELHDASKKQRHTTRPLLETYPELAKGQLQFHGDLIDDPDVDLVCTPRLTVGAKMGNGAHERVCRELRTRGFELYGIPRPPVTRRGQINFPQPPKSVLILDRHVTRNIANVNDLLQFLKQQLGPLGVPVSYVSTKDLSTAEEFVRVYSSAGVILTPHGSHNMGQIWMHRYSALIEVMPVGYTDYAFNLLSESCRIWYYELQSSVPSNLTDYYMMHCDRKAPHMLNPCVAVKNKAVWVNPSKALETILFALERLGHDTNKWLADIVGAPPTENNTALSRENENATTNIDVAASTSPTASNSTGSDGNEDDESWDWLKKKLGF